MFIGQEVEICGKDIHDCLAFWGRYGEITSIGTQNNVIGVEISTTDGPYTATLPPTSVKPRKTKPTMKEPQIVRTGDGYIFTRQENGSYTDGDMTFDNLLQLAAHTTIEEVASAIKYELGQELWFNHEPVRAIVIGESGDQIEYEIVRPDDTPHPQSPVLECKLTDKVLPDHDLLDVDEQIIHYGTASKIQAHRDWASKRIYLVYSAQGQPKWVTRGQISKFKTKQTQNHDNANILPLGSVFWPHLDCWVNNHGVVETHEGPGLEYWIEYEGPMDDDELHKYMQIPANQLKSIVHWDTAFKVGDTVEYDVSATHQNADKIFKITGYENTRRTRDSGGPDDEIIYRVLEANSTKIPTEETTDTAFQYELKEHVYKYEPGDEIKLTGIDKRSVFYNKDAVILKSTQEVENLYLIAVPGEGLPKNVFEAPSYHFELRD